ncbi:MAG: murein biosynthesis integral membrane protein MurJ [Anaerolineaceae bacterium]|nr:murein biosynthesis integral membrane protein MurJ [Anaerolineaceae bacterium]
MKKFSRITKVSLLIAAFFSFDKGLGILRQLIIGRQFGLSAELDVFNAANNLPDMLFSLISGGALAIAFIPVLSELITKDKTKRAWQLFSNIANLAFIITLLLSVIVGLLAVPLVKGELGIAPGFTPEQQDLTVDLMRLNLISTLIFSISGLVLASLQANQHFLLPALAPLLYDLGQIFGALVLAPSEGLRIGSLQLPSFNLGIKGLVYGVIIGACLHLLIQIPGLIKYKFKWFAQINLKDPEVVKVLRLMGPRLISMVFIQLIFLAQDNLASRLGIGAVTALTYGWLIMQVPETLIGTAIATALLPTLSELVAKEAIQELKEKVTRALQVMIALALPLSAILGLALLPLIQLAFGFPLEDSQVIMRASQAFLIGVVGHSLVELGVRSFYARQNARIPMLGSVMTFVIYIVLALILMNPMGAPGIALANSIAYSLQAIFLIILLGKNLGSKFRVHSTLTRSVISALIGGFGVWFILNFFPLSIPPVIRSTLGMAIGVVLAVIPIRRELRILRQL